MSDLEEELDRLRELTAEQQVVFLGTWFHARYEIPENHLPFDREDDTGFAWIYGPPTGRR